MQKMLKITFNTLIQRHTAKKHCPTMFYTATVNPTRSVPSILHNTSLRIYGK